MTSNGALPWVRLKSAAAGPQAFRRMIAEADARAKAGDLVSVLDKQGAPYGVGFYNPKSLITLRILTRDAAAFDPDAFFSGRLAQAVAFRHETLRLPEAGNVYRVVYDYADGLPGVVIDRYGDCLVLEFYTRGMFQQAERLERLLQAHFPGARFIRRANQYSETMEGFHIPEGPALRARVNENGVLFEVEPSGGYKTGFFCDQRDNRLAVAAFAAGKAVLDVCSYTGGFGLYAKKLGKAEDVTCVELDEQACALARRNANINQLKVRVVQADAFPYLRQMGANNQRYGLIVLDPYKLIASKTGFKFGRQKYLDLNRLALGLLEEGGILVTCSCSGLLPWEEFQQIVRQAAGSAGRRVQVFRKSGAGADHPVAADYPEGEYLKVLWCRVL